jgi:glycosyltransferase involved in cell wall biosynthesis
VSIGADQVTALVPVWGSYAGEFLDEAIASLLSQDVRARVVVIDNASDVAVEVRHDVEVLRAPTRLTLGGVRNFGLRHVSTPFVVVWDADDVMLPGTLGFLTERLQQADDCVALAAGIVDATTGRRYRWPRPWMTRLVRFPRAFALLQCVWSAYPTTGATLMRTDKVLDAGGYTDAVSGSDWGLGAALAFRGKLCWSERPGRVYRRRSGSVWAQNSGPGRMLEHSNAVRRRLRMDPGIPNWAHALLPLVAVAQWVALFVLRPPLLIARAIAGRSTGRLRGRDS